MSKFKNSITGKIISGFVSLTTTLWLSGAVLLMPAVVVKAQTIEDLQAQIQSLLAQITQLQVQLAALQGQPAGFSYVFNQDLSFGMTNDEVKALQQALDLEGCFNFDSYTGYYGPITREGVNCFQQKYASEILTPLGLTSATGYFGPSSRAKMNAIYGGAVVPGDGVVVVPGAPGLTVGAGTQPSATLAVQNASRLPYTVLNLTAGSEDVTVKSITVERTGLANDAVFAGIVLLDEDGTQITNVAKTLNSVHQVLLNDEFTVSAGTSKTLTVAGNMIAALGIYAGQVAFLSVVAIDAGDAEVTASLPITGAGHTINASLSVGSVTLTRGTLDPNTSPTKAVGTTVYTFSSIKLTAGSAEDVLLEQVRFNQSGSVATVDLDNVKVEVDGTSYDAVVSSDGKYFSAIFGDGVTIAKGLQKDVLIKGDIVAGSGRTVDFDLWQYQDIVVKGKTYGYYITASATETIADNDDDSEFQDANPRYDASQVAVGAGSLVVSNSSSVPAGKIANGGLGEALGAYIFDVTGEPVSFTQWALTIATNTGGGGELLTNLTIYDVNGAALAGPQDPNTAGTTVTFTNTVTLPVGKNVLTIKGNLDNDWETNDTIQLSFTPSSNLTNVLGSVTGQSITPTPGSSITANQQTVSAGSLTANRSASLASQNVIAGSSGVVLGKFVLDATASGEDVRVTSIQIQGITGTNADLDDLNTLKLLDGSTELNTGSNVLNPSGNALAADANLTFTLDAGALTIPKGTSKIVDLKGNIVSTSTPTSNTTYVFDFSAGSPDWGVTGVATGQTINETLSTGAGATITVVVSGTLTASLDSSSPTEKWYSAGSTGVTLGVLRFTGTNEDLAVTDLALQLPNTASSSAADISTLYLYDGSTLVASKVSPSFTSNSEAFVLQTSGAGSFVVPSNSFKLLTVKADLANIAAAQVGVAGHLISIATTTTAADQRSLGLESGAAANISGSAAASTGVRYYRAVPTVTKLALPTTVLSDGTKTLYKFSVSAPSSYDIALYKFTFTVATTGITSAINFQVTDDSLGTALAATANAPAGLLEVTVDSGTYGSNWITVAANTTKNFTLQASVTGASAGDSVVTQLDGDAAYPSNFASTIFMGNSALVDASGNTDDDFIWSDFSSDATTTHSLNTADWVNGYKINGLPTTNLGVSTLSL